MRHPATRLCCLLLCLVLLLPGCAPAKEQPASQKYTTQFFGTFDTVVQIIGYAPDQKTFEGYAKAIQTRFEELSRYYDRFYEYEGVNNICTVNKNAGIAPVQVPKEVLDLLEFSLDLYSKAGGHTNIAMGPVLKIWHDYMALYAGSDPAVAKLPPMKDLTAAAQLCDISKVIVDRQASTVFLEEPGMALDVGAVAKGYATQLVTDEIYAQGFTSFIISAGGNVVAMDPPDDGQRDRWPIGIQDPFADPDDPQSAALDAVMVTHESVVTSGDYQRFYFVGDRRIHHIIDPVTLMPADYYRSLTVVCADSGEADFASTCLFVLPYEESRALAARMGWKVMWVFPDGEVAVTDDLLPQLRDRGGATAVKS